MVEVESGEARGDITPIRFVRVWASMFENPDMVLGQSISFHAFMSHLSLQVRS
jgi:hypothetical protein